MERIHQMNVVPDVLPSLHPSFDLRLTFPEPPPQSTYLRNRVKRQHKHVEPGIFLVSEQVWQCQAFPLFSSVNYCPPSHRPENNRRFMPPFFTRKPGFT